MALFTNAPRNATVVAIRDSLLIELKRDDFGRLIDRFPRFALKFGNQVIERFSRSIRGEPARITPATNIAVLQRNPGANVADIAEQLAGALEKFGNVLHLRSRDVGAERQTQLSRWLDEQEERFRFIVMQGDATPTSWSQAIVQHADKVLLVGDGSAPTHMSLLPDAITGNPAIDCQCLFLHEAGLALPTDTAARLSALPAGHHHHVRRGNADDIDRVARILSGRSWGLVLAGGGARGFAHIGVIRALRESGVPVDLVGGTSMGAAIGALIAMELPTEEIYERCREGFIRSNPLTDYTLPLVSMLRGRKLDRMCKKNFDPAVIEDTWLNYFCVTANVTTDETVILDNGPLWQAVRASVSLPGIVPPVARHRQLLVDGGVANNFPVDIMISRGAGNIIAVDLRNDTPQFELSTDEVPGAATLLKKRIAARLRGGPVDAFPSVFEILAKSAWLSSTQRSDRNRALADIYLNPPDRGRRPGGLRSVRARRSDRL